MGQRWDEHGRDARQPTQQKGQGKVSLRKAFQRQHRWQIFMLRLLQTANIRNRLRMTDYSWSY